ncbi:MAG: hypothetical protein A3F24_02340 [Candidatus Colwellbacteria bacterium RIFCSPHIGHO2_12_FULL_44_17]|uniref:Peptidase S11 D-alanyl-D-alanine carboxypeptidase A N-terminal domain-containing protein n=2 Tax=Candidatus Colwelliibacteriota TaxID=1817904 RepID=A0A1G1Z6S6_9BACT|nr:MAG: hypothetical protein A3F24_02340 [Candidatus Colwellbacteria bacterium RIFCSPHIGHO2_12_FULL_44_17]OGY60325.1 MAG: hypothetical protein A3I31_02555 [Candidatus Colwellbacteria bacterium RIFCSPLOWO2_02_FULL_44_20b]
MNQFRRNALIFTVVVLVAVFLNKDFLLPHLDSSSSEIPPPLQPALIQSTSIQNLALLGEGGPPPQPILVGDLGVPDLNVEAALVKNMTTGAILFEFKADRPWPLASLTKLMTAVVAKEKLGLETDVVITEEAVQIEGAAGNFTAGEKFAVYDLIEALLVASSNDAAYALAHAYGYDTFLAEMNNLAATLQMQETTFVDPAGLSVLNQSTAYDVQKLTRYILETHPDLFAITKEKKTNLYEEVSRKSRSVAAINRFAGRKDFLGGKTGYIDEARQNLVSVFSHKSQKLLIVVFGTEDRFLETEKLLSWIQTTFVF